MTRPGGAEWRRRRSPSERAAELEDDERFVKRDMLRTLAVGLVYWIGSLAVGLGLMGWSMHTTNTDRAGIAFWAGLVIGYSGLTLTLAWVYRRGQEQDWW
jgi:hypothetical protein